MMFKKLKLLTLIAYYYALLKLKNFTGWFKSWLIKKFEAIKSFLLKEHDEKKTINKQTIIVNHIIAVKPQVDKLLEEVFVSYPIKDYLVLKNSGITSISIESKEFKIVAEKFIQNFKRAVGKKPFQELENYWGKEELSEYIILWLYYRVLRELQTNILKLIES